MVAVRRLEIPPAKPTTQEVVGRQEWELAPAGRHSVGSQEELLQWLSSKSGMADVEQLVQQLNALQQELQQLSGKEVVNGLSSSRASS
eukprot:1933927-Amphidinium_carterae.2